MERRLRELNPELHRRFTNAVIALQYNLSHYKRLFPEFTDHTILHSIGALTIEEEIRWYKVTRAVRSMEISKRAFTLHVDASDPEILEAVRVNTAKMGQALDVCRSVVCQRTPYEITQNQVLICEEL